MAALAVLRSLRASKAPYFGSYLRNFGPVVYSRSYHRRSNRKKHSETRAIDIDEILGRNESDGAVSPAISTEAASVGGNVTETTPAVTQTWKHSENRFKSLKTAEKRVAVMAVVAMLLGYVGIKWMVTAYPPKQQSSIENEPDTTNVHILTSGVNSYK